MGSPYRKCPVTPVIGEKGEKSVLSRPIQRKKGGKAKKREPNEKRPGEDRK